MAAKTSYTEAETKTFMIEVLDSVATDLDLTTASTSIARAVTAVERLLDVSDVASLTDMTVLEAASTWLAWQTALSAASTKFDLKAGSADLKLSQMFKALQAQVEYAESAYYTAVAVAEGSSGLTGFVFATIPGCRGR